MSKDIILQTLLSAGLAVGDGTTANETAGPIQVNSFPVTNNVFYVISNASQTTGTVTIQEADSTSNTGTWVTVATVTCATANTVQVVRLAGEIMAVRARVSATANGSGITVKYKAS